MTLGGPAGGVPYLTDLHTEFPDYQGMPLPGARPIVVCLNSRAGAHGDQALGDRVRELFRARHRDVEVVSFDPRRGALPTLTPQSTIVAAGGDGTVSAVAKVALDTSATLGILPIGTLNHFAKDLGLPLDL